MSANTLATTISLDLLPISEAGVYSRPLSDAEKRLQAALLEGLASPDDGEMDDAFFQSLHDRIDANTLTPRP